MKWSYTFIRLMISILLLSIVWNGCTQSRKKKEFKGKIPIDALTLRSIDFFVPLVNEEKLYLAVPTPPINSDVVGLRFQPEIDPNIYLTWCHQMSKDSFAELGWSVNYYSAVTIKFNQAFTLTPFFSKPVHKPTK